MSNKQQTAVEQFAIALYEKGFLKGNGDDIQELLEQAKEMHKQEIEQHAINFNLFVENDEVTDQKVEIIQNLYKDYLKEFYNETF